MKRAKITIIGAGNVGATCAMWATAAELADVVLVDIVEGMPQGKALDLAQAAPIINSDVRLVGSNGYEESADSEIVIITSGLPRKPGMSRDQLLETNVKIVADVTAQAVKHSPNAVLMVVSIRWMRWCTAANPASRRTASWDGRRAWHGVTVRSSPLKSDAASRTYRVCCWAGDDMVPLPPSVGQRNPGDTAHSAGAWTNRYPQQGANREPAEDRHAILAAATIAMAESPRQASCVHTRTMDE